MSKMSENYEDLSRFSKISHDILQIANKSRTKKDFNNQLGMKLLHFLDCK